MAIDTPKKRRKAAGTGIPGQTLPAPDGTIDASDREQVSGVYTPSGASPPSTGVDSSMLLLKVMPGK